MEYMVACTIVTIALYSAIYCNPMRAREGKGVRLRHIDRHSISILK